VVHTDINEAMLRVGRDRLIDKGVILPTLVCDAESCPSPTRISIWSAWPSACAT
jgi:demethylmenaquinone methyltransferase/2-methoxy-6-polyprenyl-1,4-benzoquinol methylase